MINDKKNLKLPNKAKCEVCGKKAFGALTMKDETDIHRLCKNHYMMKSMEWENIDLKSVYEND